MGIARGDVAQLREVGVENALDDIEPVRGVEVNTVVANIAPAVVVSIGHLARDRVQGIHDPESTYACYIDIVRSRRRRKRSRSKRKSRSPSYKSLQPESAILYRLEIFFIGLLYLGHRLLSERLHYREQKIHSFGHLG